MSVIANYSLLIRYVSIIGGMAAYFFATMIIISENEAADLIFFSALSFTLGLTAGDPASIIFFQRKYREDHDNRLRGFWVSRFILSALICAAMLLFIGDIDLSNLLIGFMLGYIFPSGRVSASDDMPLVNTLGGSLKIVLSSILIYFPDADVIFMIPLVCTTIATNYIASIPKISYRIIKECKVFDRNKVSIRQIAADLKIALNTFLVTGPVHLYTSLGGFYYIAIYGTQGVSQYYLAERLVRGLGATVVAVMSKTTTQVSKFADLKDVESFRSMVSLMKLYIYIGFMVGFTFSTFGPAIFNLLGFNLDILINSYIFILCASTVSLYVSTLLAVQYYMVNREFLPILISSSTAAIVLLLSLITFKHPLLSIGLSEASVSILLVTYFYLKDRKYAQGHIK